MNEPLKAVGCHVFAGGFTLGVRQVMQVEDHLETHGFGIETAEKVVGVRVTNCEDYREWPALSGNMLFGNPRCTGFSCITSGCKESAHGPWSKQTIDIHELSDYAAKGGYDAIVWESVQQAYTGTGKALIDWLIERHYAPAGYRVAHILLNAASFGNAQQRKRYFFVAYKNDKAFNITPPKISSFYSTTYDAIWNLRDRITREAKDRDDFDADTYVKLSPHEKRCAERLPNGWNLNMLANYDYDALPDKFKKTWDTRTSKMPFSLHCIHRLQWLHPFPTIHSGASRWIHPWYNRPITVLEAATAMGWGGLVPIGRAPIPQIGKGIVPDIGRWLAEQVKLYLTDAWGGDDWESSYDHVEGEWKGRDTHGELEKTFNMTKYVGHYFDAERYHYDARIPRHRWNVDPNTGRLKRPWKEIRESYRGDPRVDRLVRKASLMREDVPNE